MLHSHARRCIIKTVPLPKVSTHLQHETGAVWTIGMRVAFLARHRKVLYCKEAVLRASSSVAESSNPSSAGKICSLDSSRGVLRLAGNDLIPFLQAWQFWDKGNRSCRCLALLQWSANPWRLACYCCHMQLGLWRSVLPRYHCRYWFQNMMTKHFPGPLN